MLFWLNYKAAYDDWKEQSLALNKDIHMATREVVDKLPGIQQTSAQAFSTLFLQLTVNDLGICLPITNASQVREQKQAGRRCPTQKRFPACRPPLYRDISVVPISSKQSWF